MKLYQDKNWLYSRYIIQKKNIVEIAKECGVSAMTIQRYIDKFGIKIKR
jgi:DNA-binding MurR/RpiR family transcriptional regulator